MFATVDLLVTPSVAGPPSTIEPLTQHADLDPGRDQGHSGLSQSMDCRRDQRPLRVHCSRTPVGLQIVGAPFAEGTVLALAHAYEQATEWHKRHPALNAKVSIGLAHDITDAIVPKRL